jgi:hypothetical protein
MRGEEFSFIFLEGFDLKGKFMALLKLLLLLFRGVFETIFKIKVNVGFE